MRITDPKELNRRRKALIESFGPIIKEHGQMVQMVFPTEEDPGFGFLYTVGNHEVGLPELLAIGAAAPEIGGILNSLGEQQRRTGQRFAHNSIVYPDGYDIPVRIINASPQVKDEYTLMVSNHYGHENYDVQQVIICDRNRRMPPDPECESPWGDVPIYAVN